MPVITVHIKYHKVSIILSHSAAGGVAVGLTWRDDVCSAVYRYYFCTNCTITQCLLSALKGEGHFASWVILIGCAKTDGPITGNITGSFCILLQTNTAWPSYRRIARSISNKYINWRLSLEDLSAQSSLQDCVPFYSVIRLTGVILVGFSSDEPSSQFSTTARNTMWTITGVDVRPIAWRWKFIFITEIGSPQIVRNVRKTICPSKVWSKDLGTSKVLR